MGREVHQGGGAFSSSRSSFALLSSTSTSSSILALQRHLLFIIISFIFNPVHSLHLAFRSSRLGDLDRLPSLQLLLPPFSFLPFQRLLLFLPSGLSTTFIGPLLNIVVAPSFSSSATSRRSSASRTCWTLQTWSWVVPSLESETWTRCSTPRWRGRLGVFLTTRCMLGTAISQLVRRTP